MNSYITDFIVKGLNEFSVKDQADTINHRDDADGTEGVLHHFRSGVRHDSSPFCGDISVTKEG